MGEKTNSGLVRLGESSDVDWFVETCHRYYGDRIKDLAACKKWAENHMHNQNVIFVRTDESFGIATLASNFFDLQPIVTFHFFGGKIWEIRPIFNTIIQWGRDNNAKELYFCASTGYNIEPLAKRMGAIPFYPTYFLKL